MATLLALGRAALSTSTSKPKRDTSSTCGVRDQPAAEHQHRVHQQLDQGHRHGVRRRRAAVDMLLRPPEHRADGEQRHRRGRVAQHADDVASPARAGAPPARRRPQRPARSPRAADWRRRRASRARRSPHAVRRAAVRSGTPLRQRQAQRAGDHQVHKDAADQRPGTAFAQQPDEQRKTHEAAVRERCDQGAECGVLHRHTGTAGRSLQA